MTGPGDDDRLTELRVNLLTIRSRIATACSDAGRRADDVTLVAVTKTFPADDVRRLATLGVHDIGENRDQEASSKAADLGTLGVRWHFVGQLQANKCRSVATYADVVHSVDRTRIVDALSNAAGVAGRAIEAFVQVSLDQHASDQGGRGGALPADLPALADDVAAAANLRLVGVMAVAPVGDKEETRRAFDRLADIAASLRASHPEATAISAGMSADMEVAIAAGATHVRIGTALLGVRPLPVR